MKATISLKRLRQDPEELLRLTNEGNEVTVTRHRKPIAVLKSSEPVRGNGAAVLEAIKNLPRIKDPAPHLDTPTRLKQIKDEYFAEKYGL